jgi:hypothetical protein
MTISGPVGNMKQAFAALNFIHYRTGKRWETCCGVSFLSFISSVISIWSDGYKRARYRFPAQDAQAEQ